MFMDLRMRDDCIKNEKIDGIIYDMSPAADFRHGLINSSIHSAIKTGLKGSICRVFMENLDLYYSKDSDDYVRPDIMILIKSPPPATTSSTRDRYSPKSEKALPMNSP